MKLLLSLSLLATLSVTAAPLEAQTTPRPTPGSQAEAAHRSPDAGRRVSLGFLLRHRTEIGLTDRQITRLERIAQQLERQNEPLLGQLRAAGIPVRSERRERVREMTDEQRRELKNRLEAHRPTLMRLRENTKAAMQEARDVLTPEQRERLRQVMHEHHRDRSAEPPGQRPRTSPGR